MTRLLGLPPSIAHPSRERPLARSPARPPHGTGWRGIAVKVPALSSLSGDSQHISYYKKIIYVVYCRKKTLNDGQSRRVNQQSQHILYLCANLSRPYGGGNYT